MPAGLHKGAADVLLSRCTHEFVRDETRTLDAGHRRRILEANEELAGEALRTLGIAYREVPAAEIDVAELDEQVEHDLVFAGLIGMIDPPREEAKAAVSRAKAAGIRPVMITGDHPATAIVIAQELGIANGGKAVSGAELDGIDDDALG